jgi:hypothetical protein
MFSQVVLFAPVLVGVCVLHMFALVRGGGWVGEKEKKKKKKKEIALQMRRCCCVACFPKQRAFPNPNPSLDWISKGSWVQVAFVACAP